MIDSDRYKGHTPKPEWDKAVPFTDLQLLTIPDRNLLLDAPLLLDEVAKCFAELEKALEVLKQFPRDRGLIAWLIAQSHYEYGSSKPNVHETQLTQVGNALLSLAARITTIERLLKGEEDGKNK